MDPEDWSDTDTERQTEQILRQAKDGDIILLHDVYPSSVDTALAVVDALLARGFTFVTVEQLFALRGVEPSPGERYRCLPEQELASAERNCWTRGIPSLPHRRETASGLRRKQT